MSLTQQRLQTWLFGTKLVWPARSVEVKKGDPDWQRDLKIRRLNPALDTRKATPAEGRSPYYTHTHTDTLYIKGGKKAGLFTGNLPLVHFHTSILSTTVLFTENHGLHLGRSFLLCHSTWSPCAVQATLVFNDVIIILGFDTTAVSDPENLEAASSSTPS